METILDDEAFNLEWEFSHGIVARFRPPGLKDSDAPWQYCEVDYTVLPTDGRYRPARYRLVLSVSREPTEVENVIGDTVTSAEFELDTWGVEERQYPSLFGLSGDEYRVLEHSHNRSDLTDKTEDIDTYNYLQLRLEYDLEQSKEQLTESSPEEARQHFVGLLEEKNQFRDPDDHLDAEATYF